MSSSSSISRTLIFWLAVPLMLLALCGALVHYFTSVAPGLISTDRRLKEATNALMAQVRVNAGRVRLDAAADGVLYVLRDAQGRLLSGDPRLPMVPLGAETTQSFTLSPLGGRNLRTLSTRFDTRAGALDISVADVRPGTEPAARFSLMSTLLWDFVQLDLTLVLVWVGIQLGLRPVKKLREQIAARSALDLRPIDASSVPREIAPVVVTLNRLFLTLRTSVQSQQQFIANTAHQLRTPITGMQAQLGLLIAEPAAAAVRDRLSTLKEATRQLAHCANQLLSLARADPALHIAAKNQAVELHGLASDVIARFFDRALQSDIDLGLEAQPVTLLADPSLLDDLLSNLLDNALNYTPAGGTVTLSTGTRNGRPYLCVEDSGPGIPETERRRVLQRFYRLPNSPGHGSGLGLAIVDEIARLYAATLTIDAGSGGGTRILLCFP